MAEGTKKATIGTLYAQLALTTSGIKEQVENSTKRALNNAVTDDETVAKPLMTTTERSTKEGVNKGFVSAEAGVIAAIAGYGIAQAVQEQVQNAFADIGRTETVAAALDLSPEATERLQNVVDTVFDSGLASTREEVNATVRNIFENISGSRDFAEEELLGLTKTFVTLASVSNGMWDSERISKAASTYLNAGGDIEEFTNVLAYAQANFNTSFKDDILDTFQEYGSTLAPYGADAITAYFQALQDAGMRNSDIAADALREISVRIFDGSLLSPDKAQMLAALGLDANTMREQIQAGNYEGTLVDILNAIQRDTTGMSNQLFGSMFEDYREVFSKADFSELGSQITLIDGAMEGLNERVETGASVSFASLKNSIQDSLVSALIPMLETLSPLIESFAKWVKENPKVIVAIGALIVIIAALVAIIGILNIVMMANPVVLIIMAVIAAIGLLVILFLMFQDEIMGFFGNLGDWISATWSSFTDFISGIGSWIVNTFKSALEWLTGALKGTINFILRAVTAVAKAIVGIIETPIRLINAIFDRMRSLSFKTPWGWEIGFSWLPKLPTFADKIQVPQLADGGIISATNGGRLVNVAEAGYDEAVIPLDGRLERLFAEMGVTGKSNVVDITVNESGDGRTLAKKIAKEISWNE